MAAWRALLPLVARGGGGGLRLLQRLPAGPAGPGPGLGPPVAAAAAAATGARGFAAGSGGWFGGRREPDRDGAAEAEAPAEAAAWAEAPAEAEAEVEVDAPALTDEAALAALLETSSAPVGALQQAFFGLHEATGLPWWATIMAVTVGIRSLTLPVAVMQMKNTANMQRAKPEIDEYLARAKELALQGNDEAAEQMRLKIVEVWRKYDCHPIRAFGPILIQAPLFISFFFSVQGLTKGGLPSLGDGGALWFRDLTVADPTYALPVLCGLTFLATIEAGADQMQNQPNSAAMKNFMRALSVGIVPFTTGLPSGVFMYWVASNGFSLGQTLLFKVRAVRDFLQLPEPAAAPPASAAVSPPHLVPGELRQNRPARRKGRRGRRGRAPPPPPA